MISILRNVAAVQSRLFPKVIAQYSAAAAGSAKERIDGLVKGKKLVVFMKGTPEAPRCGFSNVVMQVLKMHGVNTFDAHDVLEDEELRQGRLVIV